VVECEQKDSAGEHERGDEDVGVASEPARCCNSVHEWLGDRGDDQGSVGSKEVANLDGKKKTWGDVGWT
jgi:hypothetical protein